MYVLWAHMLFFCFSLMEGGNANMSWVCNYMALYYTYIYIHRYTHVCGIYFIALFWLGLMTLFSFVYGNSAVASRARTLLRFRLFYITRSNGQRSIWGKPLRGSGGLPYCGILPLVRNERLRLNCLDTVLGILFCESGKTWHECMNQASKPLIAWDDPSHSNCFPHDHS